MKLNYLLISLLILFSTSAAQSQKKLWTLKECVDYAVENNISIQQAGLDIEDAELQKKSALGNFLPNANINSSHAWQTGLTQNITTGLLEDQTTQNTSLGANISVDLFTGLKNVNRKQRAELAVLASRYQLDDMKDNVSLTIANAFLQILFNKETLKVLGSQKVVTQQNLNRTRELISSGTLPPGDIYEIEASLASLDQQTVNAENNIRFSRISLAQILQIRDYENFDVANENYDIPESEVVDVSPSLIYTKALDVRNIIKISQVNVEIAERDYEIAKGNYYPTLSGFYQFNTRASDRDVPSGRTVANPNPTTDQIIGYSETSMETIRTPTSTVLSSSANPIFDQFSTNKGQAFGFQLNIPVFNRFATQVNTQRNRLNVERAKLNLEQNKVDLESSVHQAYNDANGALKSYQAAEKTLIARKEAFKYAEQRYDVGVINSFEFQQTKQALESAESELIRTKFDYIFKLKILEFYFGIPIGQQ